FAITCRGVTVDRHRDGPIYRKADDGDREAMGPGRTRRRADRRTAADLLSAGASGMPCPRPRGSGPVRPLPGRTALVHPRLRPMRAPPAGGGGSRLRGVSETPTGL